MRLSGSSSAGTATDPAPTLTGGSSDPKRAIDTVSFIYLWNYVILVID